MCYLSPTTSKFQHLAFSTNFFHCHKCLHLHARPEILVEMPLLILLVSSSFHLQRHHAKKDMLDSLHIILLCLPSNFCYIIVSWYCCLNCLVDSYKIIFATRDCQLAFYFYFVNNSSSLLIFPSPFLQWLAWQ